jgi:hypothetical protein
MGDEMKSLLSVFAALAVAALATFSTAPPVHTAPGRQAASQVLSVRQHELYGGLRKLWEDHITWTRSYIVSAVADLPDKGVVAQRLLKNQVDLGNAIKPFYGEQAGNQLSALLTDHILIAAAIIEAAKAGNGAEVEAQRALWYANSDQIADFLSSANPANWPQAMMRALMREHLVLTFAEAVAQLTGDYTGSIQKYDEIHEQALEMADMLAKGIITQFPARFRPGS